MILLKANEGLGDPQIMAAVNFSRLTVERTRKPFVCITAYDIFHDSCSFPAFFMDIFRAPIV
jgi:hypothetical protein